jgi:glycosyltransferase involved in cell wall biosynthesis
VVDAILVTFNRTQPLVEVCRSALDQSARLRTLVIVDNNEASLAAELVEELDRSATDTEIRVLHPGSNLGPAGGITAGFRYLRDRVGALDWVLLLDDDDPLPAPDIVERLLDAVGSAGADRVGGIALLGARFAPPLLLTRPIDPRPGGLIPVDSLHGWAAPLYRAAALEEVDCFRPELFWGLDDVDAGLRLVRADWRLYVAADVFLSLPALRKAVERPGRPRVRLADPSPRSYYKLRNTVDIGLRYFGLRYVLLAMIVRAVGKPIANLPVRPVIATRALRQNIRAIADGFRGRMGHGMRLPG